MTAISSLGLKLVAIPQHEFESQPSDRSLKLLAIDARALRRRTTKGVGVEIQRGLFVQVARRLDAIACERDSHEVFTVIGEEAEAWLALETVLESVALSEVLTLTPPPLPQRTAARPTSAAPPIRSRPLTRSSLSDFLGGAPPKRFVPKVVVSPTPMMVRVPLLGEQILFPGEEVCGWHMLLQALDPKRLRSHNDRFRSIREDRCVALISGARSIFAAAHTKGAAVCQVLFDAAVPRTKGAVV